MSGAQTIHAGASLGLPAPWTDQTGTALRRPDGTPALFGVDARAFGIRPSATVDCLAAMQAALNEIATTRSDGSRGGVLQLDEGVYALSGTLSIPDGTTLRGVGPTGTKLIPAAGFSTSGIPMIWLGRDGTDVLPNYVRVENLRIFLSAVSGSIGIKTRTAQEGSGAFNCIIDGWMGTGIIIDGNDGGGVQHTEWDNLIVNSHTSAVNRQGMYIISCMQTRLNRLTIISGVGGDANSTAQGLYLNNSQITATELHFQRYKDGVYFLNNSGGSVSGVDGISVEKLVHITSGSGTVDLSSVGSTFSTGITNYVADDINSAYAFSPVSKYVAGRNIVNGNLVNVSQSPAYASSFYPEMRDGDIIAPGALTGAMDVKAPAHIAKGQRFTISFLQDGVGGHAVTWVSTYKFPVAWTNTGNTANTRSAMSFYYDGTYCWAIGQNLWA